MTHGRYVSRQLLENPISFAQNPQGLHGRRTSDLAITAKSALATTWAQARGRRATHRTSTLAEAGQTRGLESIKLACQAGFVISFYDLSKADNRATVQRCTDAS
jgi:hypothetical protein